MTNCLDPMLSGSNGFLQDVCPTAVLSVGETVTLRKYGTSVVLALHQILAPYALASGFPHINKEVRAFGFF